VRRPTLQRSIIELEEQDDVDHCLVDLTSEILAKPENSLLVFTYQTASTIKTARQLSERTNGFCGENGAVAYHARMPREMRAKAREAFISGRSRCLVSTTALAAGVNLPATHLVIRDLTFHGFGPIPLEELVQMTGRAGRGTQPGHAFLIRKPSDKTTASELLEGLSTNCLPELRSALLGGTGSEYGGSRAGNSEDSMQNPAEFVLSILTRSRDAKLSVEALQAFASRSLAGPELIPHLSSAITWLTDCNRLLAFQESENGICATSLGAASSRSSLPLPLASAVGQLLRDLLSLAAEETVLRAWGELDHLLILELLADRTWSLRPFSAEMVTRIDNEMERSASKSILYTQWIRGAQGHSKAAELLGSLGLSPDNGHGDVEEWCRRRAYSALFRATILNLRARGESSDNLSREWGIEDISGFEEAWRDNRLWLLGGLSEIFDIHCFYFHLKSECDVDVERIQRVKRFLKRLQVLARQCAARVKHCSVLGPLLVQMKQSHGTSPGITMGTIEKLEALGIGTPAKIAAMSVEDFKRAGVRAREANRLQSYFRRRLHL
jgi:hypothetical protein